MDEVLRRANATEYGLASGVFTQDISRALYVSEKLNAGTVFVNTYNKTDVASPFGGFKQSGFGKDLGKERRLGRGCRNTWKCLTFDTVGLGTKPVLPLAGGVLKLSSLMSN